ncbi:hypothetical protein ACFLQ1_00220, partial [Candidatus Auribacterota bacterium]
ERTFTGVIKKLKTAQVEEKTYCLKSTGLFSAKKCYLTSEAVDLDSYKNQKVKIYGKEIAEGKVPVIKVLKLEIT